MIDKVSSIEYVCQECDSEFIVEPIGETDGMISFCPFCGSELDPEDLDDEQDEEDSWD